MVFLQKNYEIGASYNLDAWITLKVSAAGIRNIDKRGISACLKDAKEKGFLA